MFAVRIVTADYYLASPIKGLDVCYSEFRESEVKKVPVVRIFGATPAGLLLIFLPLEKKKKKQNNLTCAFFKRARAWNVLVAAVWTLACTNTALWET